MKQAKMRALVNGWLRRTCTVISIVLFAPIAGAGWHAAGGRGQPLPRNIQNCQAS